MTRYAKFLGERPPGHAHDVLSIRSVRANKACSAAGLTPFHGN